MMCMYIYEANNHLCTLLGVLFLVFTVQMPSIMMPLAVTRMKFYTYQMNVTSVHGVRNINL